MNGYVAEHRHLLLLILVVLRESTDFFPGGATGFGIFLRKWRIKNFGIVWGRNGEAQLVWRQGARRTATASGVGVVYRKGLGEEVDDDMMRRET